LARTVIRLAETSSERQRVMQAHRERVA
jgi:hypothetical protein